MYGDAVVIARDAGKETDNFNGGIFVERLKCERAVLTATPAQNYLVCDGWTYCFVAVKPPVSTALVAPKTTRTTSVPVIVVPEMEPVFDQSEVSKLKLTEDPEIVPLATTPVGICCCTGPREVVHVSVPPA